MNGKFKTIAMAGLLSLSLASGVAGAIAWFDTRATINQQTSFRGASEGAYFAGGDGTSEYPFLLTHPIHLYNLAWLQYLGYIPTVSATNSAETFFRLDQDIDMAGWTLPPIGTEDNPFLGHFNGNSHTIANLSISNDVSDFNRKPDPVRVFDSPHILGLFGVVGTYNGTGSAYSSSANAIENLTLDGATITSSSSTNDVLAGVVAGYVNGKVSGVGVKSSSLDLDGATAYSDGENQDGTAFSNISEYGSIGYAEKAYEGMFKGTTTELRDNTKTTKGDLVVQDSGDNQGWGGSIDMKTMYNGILVPWSTYTPTADGVLEYPATRVRRYDTSNKLISDEPGSMTKIDRVKVNNWSNNNGDQYRHYYQTEQKSGDDVTSSYTFVSRSRSDGTLVNNYLYLYGDTTNTVSNATTVTSLYETSAPVIRISKTIGGTPYYVRYNNGITYTTTPSDSCNFVFDSGKIFYVDNSGNNTVKRFLYRNGNALAATTTEGNASIFTYDSTHKSYYVTSSGINYYLIFSTSSNTWSFAHPQTISSGAHYLTASRWANDQTLADTTSGNAPVWYVPESGASGYIYTIQSGVTYYLRYYNATSARITTNQNNASTWSVTSGGNVYYTSGNQRYYLCYNSVWQLSASSVIGYRISNTDQTHYLSANGTSLVDQTSKANATVWQASGSNYYYTYNNQNYYIRYNENDNSRIELSTSTNDLYGKSGNTLRFTVSGWWRDTNYYIRYYNGWSTSTSSQTLLFETVYSSTPTLTLTNAAPSAESERSNQANSYNRKETTTEDATYTTKPTFFPLRQEETNSKPNGIPKDTNTGYVVSGANDIVGDIRVSQYGKTTNLPNGLNQIYSRNDDGDFYIYNTSTGVDLSSNYSKFTTSRSQLQTVLGGDSYIYGLHFVGATVSYDGGSGDYRGNSVFAPKAIVNGTTHYDYELPKDCIDFNLKEKGFINFFAGTYYSGNDCFFSLHEVERNASEGISAIKEISEVYEAKSTITGYRSFSYVYKFTDGTYSVPFKYSAGTKVKLDGSSYTEYSTQASLDTTNYNSTPIFKTAWIKKNTIVDNYAYYFEVPVNAGEFCLSSVANAAGAYLMYLDIGANAAKVNRTTITEYIKEVVSSFKYPLGVAIVANGISASDTNSYCVKLGSAYDGTVSLSRSSNTQATASYTDSTNKIIISFVSDNLTVTDGGGNAVPIIAGGRQTIETRRSTFFDYVGNSDTFTKIVVTQKTINNVAQPRTKDSYIWDSVNSKWVVDTEGKVVLYSDAGTTITNLNDVSIVTTSIEATDPMLKFYALTLGNGITVTIEYLLDGELSDTGTGSFFVVEGYAISITATDSSSAVVPTQITIISYNSSTATLTFTIGTQTVTVQDVTFQVPPAS